MAMLFVDFADAPADTSVDSELEIFSTESEDWYATSSYGKSGRLVDVVMAC